MKKIILLCIFLSLNIGIMAQSVEKLSQFTVTAYSGVFANNETNYYFTSILGWGDYRHCIQKIDISSGNIIGNIYIDAFKDKDVFDYNLKLLKSKSLLMFQVSNKLYLLDTKTDKVIDSVLESKQFNNISISKNENVISYSILDSEKIIIKSYNLSSKKYDHDFILKGTQDNIFECIEINYDIGLVFHSTRQGSGLNGILSITSMQTNKIDTSFVAAERPITQIAISKDSKYLAISSEYGNIKIYTLNDFKLIAKYESPNPIEDFQFMKKSDYIIINSESDDSKALIYSILEDKIVLRFNDKYRFAKVSLSEYNNFIATTYWNGSSHEIIIYLLKFDGLTSVPNNPISIIQAYHDWNYIYLNDIEQNTYEIYDYFGNSYPFDKAGSDINISNLKSGVYFLIQNRNRLYKFVK